LSLLERSAFYTPIRTECSQSEKTHVCKAFRTFTSCLGQSKNGIITSRYHVSYECGRRLKLFFPRPLFHRLIQGTPKDAPFL
jgi:hypothetical protein